MLACAGAAGLAVAACGDAGESESMVGCPSIPPYDVTDAGDQRRPEVRNALKAAYGEGCRLTAPGNATSGNTQTSSGGSTGAAGSTGSDDAGTGDGG